MFRRNLLISVLGWPAAQALARPEAASNEVKFPDDFGSHPDTQTEWWYVTGALQSGPRRWGFQVTFFRSATGIGPDARSRFAPQQLIFAHAALTDVQSGRQWHDQAVARASFGVAEAALGRTDVRLRRWQLTRGGPIEQGIYQARVDSNKGGWALDLTLATTQAPLRQGDRGLSRKGPGPQDHSHYYTEPQLAVQGRLQHGADTHPVNGRAWLDHEWSQGFLPQGAVGWDWIGMNLDDGSALTAFQLRRSDGSTLFAGGSWRTVGGAQRNFAPDELKFIPQRHWRSPASGGLYPVSWTVQTPVGRFTVDSLLDAQELDSRASTGAWYWEGLCALLNEDRRPVGQGYLEMTGVVSPLRL